MHVQVCARASVAEEGKANSLLQKILPQTSVGPSKNASQRTDARIVPKNTNDNATFSVKILT